MKNKLIVVTVAGLALLGPTLAAAECPAFLNAEEGVPCMMVEATEVNAESPAPKAQPRLSRESDTRPADIEAWELMVQDDR